MAVIRSLTQRRLRHHAQRCEERGEIGAAIAAWSNVNRAQPSPAIEEHLAALRCNARATAADRAPARRRELVLADPFPEVRDAAPEIESAALTPEVLGGAVLNHGCLLVRNLFTPTRVDELVDAVDRAFEARERQLTGAPTAETTPWYVPCARWDAAAPRVADAARRWSRQCGAVQAVDAPRALFQIIDALEAVDLVNVVSRYLSEAAALSVNKTTIRRVPPDAFPAWHQDGAFMGRDVRAIDVWVALADCGGDTDAPGLDVLPRRLDDLAPHGTPGAAHKDSVSVEELGKVSGGVAVASPTFARGDALLFDEMCLHATGGRKPALTRARFALEAWLFAPSTFPDAYIPMYV